MYSIYEVGLIPPRKAKWITESKYAIVVHLPENLDIRFVVAKNGLPFASFKGKPWRHIDKLAYITSLANEIPARKKDSENPEGWVSINAKILEKIVGEHYNEYLAYLVKVGVLELKSKNYQAGKSSRKYRFTEKYRGQRYKPYYLRLKNLVNHLRKFAIPITNPTPIQERLLNTLKKVRIDLAKAIELAPELAEEKLKSKGISADNSGEDSYNQQLLAKENSYKIAAEHLDRGQFFFKTDKFGKRLHHNVSNLKKELRHYISIDGYGRVAELDLKNSQPYLLTSLLHKDMDKTVEAILKNLNRKAIVKIQTIKSKRDQTQTVYEIIPEQEGILTEEEQLSIIMLLKMDGSGQLLLQFSGIAIEQKIHDDVDTYLRLAGSGEFYEFMQVVLFELTSRKSKVSRKRAKEVIMQFFFEKTSKLLPREDYQAFKKVFPTITSIIEAIKENNRKDLARFLQRLESFVITELVPLRVYSESDTVQIVTIHDSFLAPEEHIPLVNKHLELELFKITGLKPRIHFEKLGFESVLEVQMSIEFEMAA